MPGPQNALAPHCCGDCPPPPKAALLLLHEIDYKACEFLIVLVRGITRYFRALGARNHEGPPLHGFLGPLI